MINTTSIINGFITAEMNRIYRRYNSIPEQERSMVAAFVERVEANKLNYDPYQDYENTKAMAEMLKDEDNTDVIRFSMFLRLNLNLDVDLVEARMGQNALDNSGYCRIRGYHIYHSTSVDLMEEMAEEELDGRLDDSYEVAEIFNIDDLAEMWVSGASKAEAARKYLREHDWWDVIGCDEPERGYVDSSGNEVFFCFGG